MRIRCLLDRIWRVGGSGGSGGGNFDRCLFLPRGGQGMIRSRRFLPLVKCVTISPENGYAKSYNSPS